MTNRTGTGVGLAVSIAALVAVARGDAAADLTSRLQGSWQATKVSGGPHKADDPSVVTLAVDGDHLTLSDHGHIERATITVDPASSPTQFELKQADGKQMVSGIVDVTADTLRMAFRKQGQGDRPTSFDPADGVSVLVLQRAAAATSQPAGTAATRP